MKIIFLIAALFFCNRSYPQYAPLRYSRDSISFLSKEHIIADLDEYASVIIKKHVHPFSYVKKGEFLDRLKQLKDSAYKYDVDELMVKWLAINALIQDEHTNIIFAGRDVFPYQAYWFQEGIYITGTDNDNKEMLYSRVIAVNNIPVDSVVKGIATLVTNNNLPSVKYAVTEYLFDPFILHGLGIARHRNNIVYTIINEAHDTVNITPKPLDKRSLKLIYNNPLLRYSQQGKFWFKYVDQGNYVYFKYASCEDDKEHPFRRVREDLIKIIKDRKPEKIIIDMRDNRGGFPYLLAPFIEDLTKTELNRQGRLFVLIGRKTFSAAIINSAELKEKTYAELVGEETSGSTFFYGGTEYKQLPATHLMIQYSTAFWATDEKNTGSLKPNIEIPETFSNYYNKTDAALNYAINK